MHQAKQKSLRGKLLGLTLLSFLVVTISITLVGIVAIWGSMTKQVRLEMQSVVSLVESRYDDKYPGTFGIELLDDGKYKVYKGNSDISQDYSIIDEIKENFGFEVTVFCKNIRVQTTMKDENGNRYITTKAPTLVTANVIDKGQEAFYGNVTIHGVKHFAYYRPIMLDGGTVYGMIGISRSAGDVRLAVVDAVLPLVGVCLILSLSFPLLYARFLNKFTDRISALQKFMNAVAKGNFNTEIPASVLQQEDELGQLARDGRQMQHAIRVLVEYDALTQLYNRRYGDKRLHKMLSSGKGTRTDFCVAIGDIDFFKKVNDTYGHEMGDQVLREVSGVLKKHMTGKGFVARWGGEEFLIVLERMNLDDGERTLEQILDEIRTIRIPYREQQISVTMSFGIAACKQQGDVDTLLKQADDLLYLAKENGRNQIQRG